MLIELRIMPSVLALGGLGQGSASVSALGGPGQGAGLVPVAETRQHNFSGFR